jgi:hypothetical protein
MKVTVRVIIASHGQKRSVALSYINLDSGEQRQLPGDLVA